MIRFLRRLWRKRNDSHVRCALFDHPLEGRLWTFKSYQDPYKTIASNMCECGVKSIKFLIRTERTGSKQWQLASQSSAYTNELEWITRARVDAFAQRDSDRS